MDRGITMEDNNTEEIPERVITPEQALQAYEQRLQEQTAIIFGLVAKMGGKAVLTEADFEASEQFNTILANNNENDDVVLELAFEERP
jgi:apolipoprotein N-acyltransferase